MSDKQEYSYKTSVKSDISDEIINTYVIRPIAGFVVRAVFRTSITPNQITIASIAVGIVAAAFYAHGFALPNFIAGICITLKDILDSADGQLARAKKLYSRSGRFLDSIGDFFVNAFAFGAIGWALYETSEKPIILFLAIGSFLSTTLRVSYHVFYQTSFLHLHDAYRTNRVTEELRPEDHSQNKTTMFLQNFFLVLYGWQDRLMALLDAWSRRARNPLQDGEWFGNTLGLRLSGMLGLGTELFFLTMFSLVDQLEAYLYFNLTALNTVWLASVMYRRFLIAPQLSGSDLPSR